MAVASAAAVLVCSDDGVRSEGGALHQTSYPNEDPKHPGTCCRFLAHPFRGSMSDSAC